MTNIDRRENIKKKVLIVSNDTKLGGAALSLFDMINALVNDVIFIAVVPGDGPVLMRLNKLGVKTYVVPFLRDYIEIDKYNEKYVSDVYCSNYLAALKVVDIVKEETVDIIHTNSSVGNVGAIASVITGVPHVWHVREFMEEDFNARYCDRRLKKILFDASHIVSISDCIKENIFEKYSVQSRRIYNAVNGADRLDNFRNSDNHNIMIAGAITENKGQWDAINAVFCLRDRGYDDVFLTIIGGGSQSFLWTIKKYIKKKKMDNQIRIIDFVDDLQALRSENSIALVTSRMEALGRVTVEAMCARQIVIGADTGGTKEIIGTDKTRGLLYRQGDAKSLADTIEECINFDDDSRKEMINAASIFARKKFNSTSFAEQIGNIYTECSKHESNSKIVELLQDKYNSLRMKRVTILEETYYKAKLLEKKWDEIEEKRISIANYLLEHGIRRIAIYGMGNFGKKLFDCVEDSLVNVDYVIDKNPGHLREILNVKLPEDVFDDVEMLVIAVSAEENELKHKYKKKYKFRVIGLSELLDNILNSKKKDLS